MNKIKLILICREVDKSTGEIAAYEIPRGEEDLADKFYILQLREALNPELKYFVTTEENFEENEERILSGLRRGRISKELLVDLKVVAIRDCGIG